MGLLFVRDPELKTNVLDVNSFGFIIIRNAYLEKSYIGVTPKSE